jgi:uncharacterized protein YkwD
MGETEYPESSMINIKAASYRANQLINSERKRRKIPPVVWCSTMYTFAKSHADNMAQLGSLFHSLRPALQGGENCWGGKGYYAKSSEQLARAMVKGWMSSPKHRAWILDKRIKSAAVGISISKKGTFAAWAFSESMPRTHKPTRTNKSKGSMSHRLCSFLKDLLGF